MNKLNIKYIQEQIPIIAIGYKLLSLNYDGCMKKLEFLCDKNHNFKTSWSSFKSGSRCPICNTHNKLTIEELKKQILVIAPGYELLSKKYINAQLKLKFVCPKGHEFEMNWSHFKTGRRCSKCFGGIKLTYKYIKKQIEKNNYKLLSIEYINALTKLKFQCPEGHKFWMRWANFHSGQRCPKCYKLSRFGSGHPMWKNYTKKELKELKKYKANVIQLSNRNYRKYKNIINPNNLERGRSKYHLDHIFSIIEGFRRNIPIKYMVNPYNLQMLYGKKNIIKKDTCWQSEKKLYQGYAKFQK